MAGIKSLDHSDDDYLLNIRANVNTHPEVDRMLLLLACLEFRWHTNLCCHFQHHRPSVFSACSVSGTNKAARVGVALPATSRQDMNVDWMENDTDMAGGVPVKSLDVTWSEMDAEYDKRVFVCTNR